MSHAVPEAFIARVNNYLGDDAQSLLQSLQTSAPTSIRINPKKIIEIDSNEKVNWCKSGFYLNERPVFTLDPLFQAGCYYVQEAASMFLGFALKQTIDPEESIVALDLCAAPGGKSTHILSSISANSTLISNEIIPNRNKILRENLTKWGFANSIVTQNDASQFATSEMQFDVIVVDAPCSGEGLFRKDPASIEEWSVENVDLCCSRQINILEEIKECLKENGLLFYSTCTYEPSENDDQIERLQATKEFEIVKLKDVPDGITLTKYGYQFYPHKTKGEGFYLAVLKKITETPTTKDKGKSKSSMSSTDQYLGNYLKNPEEFTSMQFKEFILAIPHHTNMVFQKINSKLHIKSVGLTLGTPKGKDFIPAHELALSIDINPEIKRIELSKEDALVYMKCDAIKIDRDYKGWAVVTYQNHGLGWIKLVPGRVNNYFPKELRIKMEIK
ncbi:MAG TPA: RNA methyltransferase [Bacteroidia bacterium]|jgi:16S rRNA C967 or C1407 C5-methylase (RsmB/RsmF family)/NOL1/NOP2/fmu family ribosome biogenesis protein|nr:RNA methyltransferase [Bacteroidia bacterium]HQK96990.1 RNA methyltransferase [Bacteroidia bacterium]